jgi:hypothetical protein
MEQMDEPDILFGAPDRPAPVLRGDEYCERCSGD